ncbi:MAG: ABC transporter ATP-binding protein, partial [Lachnospiraceae bacterium]|nr:ABC transporter ATP-binding protein [Lachnospiraceae bacterium]
FHGTPPINVFKGCVKNHMIYIGDNAILKAEKAHDGDVYVGIRPEGFIPDENGELEVNLKCLEVMGRDTTIVSDHESCENVEIRSIVSAETKIDTGAGTVRFKVKPAKTYIFDAGTEERIYY